MRAVEIFSSNEYSFEKQTVLKSSTVLVTNGIKGIKPVNLVALCVDTAINAINAIDSYLTYAKEREITKQIRLENKLIKQELDAQLQMLNLQHIEEIEEGKIRIEALNQQLKLTYANNRKLIKSISDNITHTKRMLQLVRKERENNANFEKLQKLQLALDNFIRASLMLLIYSSDNTTVMAD